MSSIYSIQSTPIYTRTSTIYYRYALYISYSQSTNPISWSDKQTSWRCAKPITRQGLPCWLDLTPGNHGHRYRLPVVMGRVQLWPSRVKSSNFLNFQVESSRICLSACVTNFFGKKLKKFDNLFMIAKDSIRKQVL